MLNRREDLLDAAIEVIGEHGIRALTHRAVDRAAGLPAGSTSNYFRTSDALLDAVVERFAVRERANWEEITADSTPTTPAELAQAITAFAHDSTGPHRTLTLARYAILLEAAVRPALRVQLATTGARVAARFTTWLRMVGSTHPEVHTRIVANMFTGLVLHQLSYPNPSFDPSEAFSTLIAALVGSTSIEPTMEVAK